MEVPAKLYDYLKVGRPILAFTVRGSEVEALLRQSGIAHVCLYEDQMESQVDASILEFARLEPVARPMAPQFEQQFNAMSQTGRLAGIFDKVLANSKIHRGPSNEKARS